jgi:phosphohistidine swiveling domain-containing protein
MSISQKSSLERGGMLIYPWYISDLTSSIDFYNEFGVGVEEILIVNKGSFLQAYYDVESADAVGKFLFEKILKDKVFYRSVIDNIYKKSDILERFCQSILNINDITSLTNDELIAKYEEYIIKLRDVRLWGWVPVLIDGFNISFLSNTLLDNFKKFLATKNLEDKVSDYYSVLSSCDKPSEVSGEKIKRLKLLEEISGLSNGQEILDSIVSEDIEKIKKYKEIYEKIEAHRQSFEWLTYAYSGPLMSIEYLIKVLKDDILNEKTISEQYQSVVSQFDKLKEEKKLLSLKLEMPEDLEYLFELSAEMMFMKDWRKGVYQKSYVVMDKILGELARRMDFDMTQIKYVIAYEIKDALSSNKVLELKTKVMERMIMCCYHIKNQVMTIYEGNECERKISELLPIEEGISQKDEIIKGMIAYKGKVTGIAKIVLNVTDMEKVNDGDILISSSTNPDLIVAMGKARAFVTDMGGITSHAAIVSREMKKPCIVGTRNATRLIKDGDLIEVDANNGIVKILK